MRLSQRANYLDSGLEVEVADIRNYSTAFQIVDLGGLKDLRQTNELRQSNAISDLSLTKSPGKDDKPLFDDDYTDAI